ncbi:hypothetical protein M7I_5349 [Glarea lozoyensis 74030]|uniref:Uncharacterized protein n=1 Tax=Glarea lozoyensis (strain ATCC 74030 / MF5533) TaxID=1104152 RepID=H0ERM8_GLAL7|nr:hypothetical protein M7I_5349 [Glarea lozoyensis 74030]
MSAGDRREPVEVPAYDTTLFPTDPAGVSFSQNPSGPAIASATYASGGLDTPGSNTPIPAGPTTLNTSLSQLSGAGDWIGKSSGFPQEFEDPHELEPMQPLIDLWAANGTLPKDSKAYGCANLRAGERLLQLAGP